ncbi:hypothetical protein, partial [Mesorhizobium sp. M7A.F.Ca.US.008.03.1.1]|uniref:hypothetical protein n=1 Tax=Mesorhizobium sp. M7A.F.Ca.US.008.03.1.1 TaxID=2496742 RepID=UPI0019D2D1F0
ANFSQDRQNQRHHSLLCFEKASQESFFCCLAIHNQLICDSPASRGEIGSVGSIAFSSTVKIGESACGI